MRGSLNGIPALARIPLLGKLFGNSEKNISQTDLIFSITPKIIRRTPISALDNEAIWSGSEQAASSDVAPAVEGEEPEADAGAADEGRPQAPPQTGDRVTITPGQASLPVDSDAFFSLGVMAGTPLSSLSLSGGVSGAGCEIVEIKTDALSDKDVKVLKNISGKNFDLGLSFSGDSSRTLAATAIQLKVKFTAKGNYILNVSGVNAYDAKRNKLEIAGVTCPIDVY